MEMKMEEMTKVVIWGVVSWSTAYLVIRKSLPKSSFDTCSRLVSTAHSILAVYLASASLEDWTSPLSPLPSNHSSPLQVRALAVTLAFLVYELICYIFNKRLNMDNAIHHLIGIIGIIAAFYYQQSGSKLVVVLWLTEISTPFLHLRDYLKDLGIRNTNLNLAVDIAFAVIFSLARIVFGPYILYMTLSGNNPLIYKVMGLGLQLVSIFWFYKIVQQIKYKVTMKGAPTHKKAS